MSLQRTTRLRDLEPRTLPGPFRVPRNTSIKLAEKKHDSEVQGPVAFPQQNRKNALEKSTETQARILQSYDCGLFCGPIEEYYEYSDFANWGYWRNETQTQKEACETLMEELLNLIPEKRGTILDVACGKGATTRYLTKYYDAKNVAGINISQKQLVRARKNAPGCKFLLMDATHLTFRDNFFDAVICVEAAFHFATRKQFLSEAYRVLRPGGYLAVSDILFYPGAESAAPTLHAQNWVGSPSAYRRRLMSIGFQDVRVIDATEECANSFDRYIFNYVLNKLRFRQIDWNTFKTFMTRRRDRKMAVRFYVLASGKKYPASLRGDRIR